MIWRVVTIVLLVVPRIFLIPMESSGIRIEDLLLLILAPSALSLLERHEMRMGKVLRALLIYYGVVIASALIASMTNGMSLVVSLAFGLRPVLYIAAFVVGYHVGLDDRGKSKGLITLASYAVLIHLAYGLGVTTDVLPNVASFDSSRLSGMTNGPYDLSAMICLTCVLLLSRKRVGMTAVSIAALLWTQSRIALAALLFHMMFRGGGLRGLHRRVLPTVALALAVAAVGVRNDAGGITQALSYIGELRENFSEASSSRADYLDAAYSEEADAALLTTIEMYTDGDPSALVRIVRWSIVAATAMDSPVNLLLGMGPGYYSVALDGNYIRLVGETGLLGLLAFLFVFFQVRAAFTQPWARNLGIGLIVQLLIIGGFIDIFVSLKTMCLFWMAVGAVKREEIEPDLNLRPASHA